MRTEIVWAELHSPLFLAGTNLSQKLDIKKRPGLVMQFDEEKHQMYVTFNGNTARVPEPSILSMVEGKAEEPKKAPAVRGPIKAQASSPHDHVFAGPGAGDTGVKGKMKF